MQPVWLRQSAPLHTERCGSKTTKHPPQIKHINILTAPSAAHRKCWRRGFNLFGLRSIEMVVLVSARSENNYARSREAPSVPFVQSRGLCDAIREDKYVTRDALRERRPLSTSTFPRVLQLPPVVGRYRQKWWLQDKVGCFLMMAGIRSMEDQSPAEPSPKWNHHGKCHENPSGVVHVVLKQKPSYPRNSKSCFCFVSLMFPRFSVLVWGEQNNSFQHQDIHLVSSEPSLAQKHLSLHKI